MEPKRNSKHAKHHHHLSLAPRSYLGSDVRSQLLSDIGRVVSNASASSPQPLHRSFAPSVVVVVVVVVVFFTLNRSFYASTSSATSVRADSLNLEIFKFCGHKATPQRYYVATYVMQCHVIILRTTGTTYPFHDLEKQKRNKEKKQKQKQRQFEREKKQKKETKIYLVYVYTSV